MLEFFFGISCKECGADYYLEDGYNSRFCSYDCKWEWDEERSREREEERKRKWERERSREQTRIKSEIDSFKETSKRQIGNKYGVEITFNDKVVNITDNNNGKIAHLKNNILELKTENSEIKNFIDDLQKAKNAI